MRQRRGDEARTGIAEVEGEGAFGADGIDAHVLVRVEPGTVFDGVQQDLAEGHQEMVHRRAGEQAPVELVHERDQAIGGDQLRADAQRDPVRRGTEHADAALGPVLSSGRLAHEVGNLIGMEGTGEDREHFGTDGLHHGLGCGRVGQEDRANTRTERACASQELEVLLERGRGTEQQRVERLVGQALQTRRRARGEFDVQIVEPGQSRDQVVLVGALLHDEQASHGARL